MEQCGKRTWLENEEKKVCVCLFIGWVTFFSLLYKLHVTPPYSTIDRDDIDIETPFSSRGLWTYQHQRWTRYPRFSIFPLRLKTGPNQWPLSNLNPKKPNPPPPPPRPPMTPKPLVNAKAKVAPTTTNLGTAASDNVAATFPDNFPDSFEQVFVSNKLLKEYQIALTFATDYEDDDDYQFQNPLKPLYSQFLTPYVWLTIA